jgi:hypothetical protein
MNNEKSLPKDSNEKISNSLLCTVLNDEDSNLSKVQDTLRIDEILFE